MTKAFEEDLQVIHLWPLSTKEFHSASHNEVFEGVYGGQD